MHGAGSTPTSTNNNSSHMEDLCDLSAATAGSSSTSSSIGRLGADAFVGCGGGGAATPDNSYLLGDEICPLPRDRCNTWPLRRPQVDPLTQTSPIVHEQIPEEDPDLFDSNEQLGQLGATNGSNAMLHSPDGGPAFSPGMSSPGLNSTLSPAGGSPASGPGSGGAKKATTRRNAWGNLSYADLITKAIMESPEQRLTLAQVYEWMVQNVSYFRDKGDSNSSAGWKNSIRHNLSLHSRFMRIQNEGAGKSSWWVINPEAKPGRNPRRPRERSNTIESSTKATLEKSRRGAKKRNKDRGMIGTMHNTINGSTTSVISGHDLYDDDQMQGQHFDNMQFRNRAQSNLSVAATSSRVSPSALEQPFEEFDFPTWIDSAAQAPQIPNDIVDRTDQIRLDPRTTMTEIGKEKNKNDSIAPPSYHELNSVTGGCTQNPLLRNPIAPTTKFHPMPMPSFTPYPWNLPNGQHQHHQQQQTPPPLPNVQSCGAVAAQQQSVVSSSSALPIDLENLTLPDQPLMDMDVESLLRHELLQNQKLSFD